MKKMLGKHRTRKNGVIHFLVGTLWTLEQNFTTSTFLQTLLATYSGDFQGIMGEIQTMDGDFHEENGDFQGRREREGRVEG